MTVRVSDDGRGERGRGMMVRCVNLAERFGKRFRVSLEAGGATQLAWPLEDRGWLQEIRGRKGVVSPWGGELLQAYSDRPGIARRLRGLPFVLHARGDVEVVVRFHVDHAEQVFALIRPYRRRRVSDAERARLVAMGRANLARINRQPHVESDFPTLESTIAPENAPPPETEPVPHKRNEHGAARGPARWPTTGGTDPGAPP